MRAFFLHPSQGAWFLAGRIGLRSTGSKLWRFLLVMAGSCGLAALASLATAAEISPEQLLLKDYRPKSIFEIPETRIEKAHYPVIDVHSHNYARTDADVDRWVETMNEVGLEKTVILAGNTGTKFDQVLA